MVLAESADSLTLGLRDTIEIVGSAVIVAVVVITTRESVKRVEQRGADAVVHLKETFAAALETMRAALAPHADAPVKLATLERDVAAAKQAAETAHGKAGVALAKIGKLERIMARFQGVLEGRGEALELHHHGDDKEEDES